MNADERYARVVKEREEFEQSLLSCAITLYGIVTAAAIVVGLTVLALLWNH